MVVFAGCCKEAWDSRQTLALPPVNAEMKHATSVPGRAIPVGGRAVGCAQPCACGGAGPWGTAGAKAHPWGSREQWGQISSSSWMPFSGNERET